MLLSQNRVSLSRADLFGEHLPSSISAAIFQFADATYRPIGADRRSHACVASGSQTHSAFRNQSIV